MRTTGTNSSTGSTTAEHYTEFSGSANLPDTDRWVTWGPTGVEIASLGVAHGSAAEPTINISSRGIFYKKGTIIKELAIMGSFSATGATEISTFVRADISDFNNINTNTPGNRVVDNILTSTALDAGIGYTNINITILDLNNYVMPEDGFVSVFFRGLGTYTGTRNFFFDAKIKWE